jgi:arsenate reductase
MQKTVIFHNSRCSKSRAVLEMLRASLGEEELVLREYMKSPPTAEEIFDVCQSLQVSPDKIVRTKEPLFKELGLSIDDSRTALQWCELLSNNPSLIERPIVVRGKKAVVARPPEKVNELLARKL